MISRSETLAHIFLNLLNAIAVERVTELKVLGVSFDTNLSFKSHIRLVAASVSSKHVIIRKASCMFRDSVMVLEVFLEFTASSVRILLSCLDVCCCFSS